MQQHHQSLKKCKLCGMAMAKLDQLEQHVARKHSHNYPYAVCNRCPSKFIDEKELAKHTMSGVCCKLVNSETVEDVDVEMI